MVVWDTIIHCLDPLCNVCVSQKNESQTDLFFVYIKRTILIFYLCLQGECIMALVGNEAPEWESHSI